ncbi:TlpA family protein disulfide reductase [Aureibaculum luteum]|uniref:TlpA family protein disulfide reductase n=1 Tax=Aureibaculum luteum TaxID=1548456 RepID=UPI00130078E5|nr:TlpA disulfide reductase family protein [Aureibaculum luteum]
MSKTNVNDISIELTKTDNDSIAFDNFYSIKMVSSLYNFNPKFYQSQFEYKNIPNVDSLLISTLVQDYNKFKYDLYKLGFLDSLSPRIDSLIEKKKPALNVQAIVTYFSNGKQTVIFDENNNKDFSDDQVLTFNENYYLEYKDQRIDTNLPVQNLNLRLEINDSIIFQKRKVIIYPSAYSYYTGSLSNDEVINKSRIHFKFKDYWKGKFSYQDKKYDLAIQGFHPRYLTFLIKPDSFSFSKTSSEYNANFTYKLKDTIQLNNDYFVLDTIKQDMFALKLKKLDSLKEFFSDKMGYKLKDYQLLDLNNVPFSVDSALKEKDYVLLDFWGTWCLPCIALTPQLKRLFDTFENLNIVGIATDRDIASVKDYVKKNDISWKNTFNDASPKGIKRDLRISAYPTFILIDNNRNIVYRGVGKLALNEIEEIINKKTRNK